MRAKKVRQAIHVGVACSSHTLHLDCRALHGFEVVAAAANRWQMLLLIHALAVSSRSELDSDEPEDDHHVERVQQALAAKGAGLSSCSGRRNLLHAPQAECSVSASAYAPSNDMKMFKCALRNPRGRS